MEDLLSRFFGNLVGRLHGPLTFRLIMQPAMAALLATLAGVRDARSGRPPYGWALLTESAGRRRLLREGWRGVANVFLVATLVDVVYQLIAFQWVYPMEAVTTAALLAIVPYVLIRGPVNRVASKLMASRGSDRKGALERDRR